MGCCWERQFDGNIVEPRSWALTTPGWIDIASAAANSEPGQSGADAYSKIFSGLPGWLDGPEGLKAWRVYTDAVSRFLIAPAGQHHHGLPDQAAYLRTFASAQFGALVPVIVLSIPTGYLNAVTPTFRNTFRMSTAYDFTGDLTTCLLYTSPSPRDS